MCSDWSIPPDHVLDHGSVVRGVAIHEDPGAGDGDGGEGAHMIDHTHSVPVQLSIVHHPPDDEESLCTFKLNKIFLKKIRKLC